MRNNVTTDSACSTSVLDTIATSATTEYFNIKFLCS